MVVHKGASHYVERDMQESVHVRLHEAYGAEQLVHSDIALSGLAYSHDPRSQSYTMFGACVLSLYPHPSPGPA